MLALNLPDLGTTVALAIVVIAFIVLGLAKGMVRMTFALVALTAGILAGLWGFQKGGAIAGTLISEPDPWMSAAVGIILGLAIFFVARALFGVLLSPVSVKDGRTKNFALPGGFLGLLMGVAFAWFLLSGVRYVGTLAELQWIRAAVADKNKLEEVPQPFFAKVKRALDASGPGQFHQNYDFLNNPAHANLAKLTLLMGNTLAIPIAANADKAFRETVYERPRIKSMLENQSADLRAFIVDAQYSLLLRSEPIREVCRDEDAATALAELDIEKALGLIKEVEKKDDKKMDKEEKK